MPWRAVWPGAAFVTIGAGLANWLFPFYLSNVSSLSRFGSTLGFILIALLWFYVLSLALLAGAVINSLRHELHDTGELPYATAVGRTRLKTTVAAEGPVGARRAELGGRLPRRTDAKSGVVEAADDIPPQIRVAAEIEQLGARPITASSQAAARPGSPSFRAAARSRRRRSRPSPSRASPERRPMGRRSSPLPASTAS